MRFLIGNSLLALGLGFYFNVTYPKAWLTGLVIGLVSIGIDKALTYVGKIIWIKP